MSLKVAIWLSASLSYGMLATWLFFIEQGIGLLEGLLQAVRGSFVSALVIVYLYVESSVFRSRGGCLQRLYMELDCVAYGETLWDEARSGKKMGSYHSWEPVPPFAIPTSLHLGTQF